MTEVIRIDKIKSKDLKLRTIGKVFEPKNTKEVQVLWNIHEENRFIDIKPYSHNLVMINLTILENNHQYDAEKIKLVVRSFGLDKKGWKHLLDV